MHVSIYDYTLSYPKQQWSLRAKPVAVQTSAAGIHLLEIFGHQSVEPRLSMDPHYHFVHPGLVVFLPCLLNFAMPEAMKQRPSGNLFSAGESGNRNSWHTWNNLQGYSHEAKVCVRLWHFSNVHFSIEDRARQDNRQPHARMETYASNWFCRTVREPLTNMLTSLVFWCSCQQPLSEELRKKCRSLISTSLPHERAKVVSIERVTPLICLPYSLDPAPCELYIFLKEKLLQMWKRWKWRRHR